MARPGGNITGFTSFELTIGGKWLETLKEIAPRITRLAVILNPENPSSSGFLGVIDATASSTRVEQVVPVAMRGSTASERAIMEQAIEAFARGPNGGLIVLPDYSTIASREKVVALAARQRLPAIYPFRYFVTAGGLIAYGVDQLEQSRRAASYVDRILKGEKPGDLPVQAQPSSNS